MNETVVLMGAGASLPKMQSVRNLTDFLLTWPDHREPPTDPADLLSRDTATIPLGGNDARTPLFAALARTIAPTVRNPDELDFEQLVHVCEQLGSIFPLPALDDRLDKFRFLAAAFLSPAASAAHFNISSLEFAAQDACYAILEEVARRCDLVSSSDHPQALGLAALARRTRLRAFSLNYDDLPFASGVEFYDGWTDEGFRPTYPWPRDRHTLCQLHGSVLWGHHEARPFELFKFASRGDARAHRNVRSGSIHFMDRSVGANAPMITGLRKADRIMERPYGTYFHVFRDELLRCPNWLIVGYGFRDPHVNNAIAQARANWQQRGIRQRIAVVDYHDFAWADPDGIEIARMGGGVSSVLDRVLGPVFRPELQLFHQPITASIRRGVINPITNDLAVWLDGAEAAFTLGREQIFSWLGVDHR